MSESGWRLPPSVRAAIFETSDRLVSECRNQFGVIDMNLLKDRVLAELSPLHLHILDQSAPPFAVGVMVEEWKRLSKNPMIVDSKDQVAGERRARQAERMQRELVTYRDESGRNVTKEFRQLSKFELRLLIQTEDAVHAASAARLAFYRNVYRQMELRGLDDGAIVDQVIAADAETEAVAI